MSDWERSVAQERGQQRSLRYTSSITPFRLGRKEGTGGRRSTFLPVPTPFSKRPGCNCPVTCSLAKTNTEAPPRAWPWARELRRGAEPAGCTGPRRCGAGTVGTLRPRRGTEPLGVRRWSEGTAGERTRLFPKLTPKVSHVAFVYETALTSRLRPHPAALALSSCALGCRGIWSGTRLTHLLCHFL